MFNGAQRLEKRQLSRYGNNPEYKAYAEKTPIILPLVPIYHLNKESKLPSPWPLWILSRYVFSLPQP